MRLRYLISAVLLFAIAAFAQNPITADSPFQVRYAANLDKGESFIDIVNTGANGAPLQGPGGAAVGNVCVNVYAFLPNQQLLSCCSCLVSPNAVLGIGVNQNLVSDPATTTSVTIKLLATRAGSSGTGTDCTSSAVIAGGQAFPVILGGAFAVYGTTLHEQPITGGGTTYVTTETAFTPATLSTSELNSITYQCNNFLGASSSGICNSCSPGAR